jgi:hypothetical protein
MAADRPSSRWGIGTRRGASEPAVTTSRDVQHVSGCGRVDQVMVELEAYASALKQLERLVVAGEGDSSAAGSLLRDLTDRDFGMLCWRVLGKWRTRAEWPSTLEPLLLRIDRAARNLEDRGVAIEWELRRSNVTNLSDLVRNRVAYLRRSS